MPNLLKAMPKLLVRPRPGFASFAFCLCVWSDSALGRHISERELPFLSVETANKILDRIAREFEAFDVDNWIKQCREAINN